MTLFQTTAIIEKVTEGIISKPDVPISILVLILVIAGLFYLLIRNYKQTDKIADQLEKNNTLMSTLIQLTNTDHEATITNRDILQRFDVCLTNQTTQVGNLFTELRAHRDECNRKLYDIKK